MASRLILLLLLSGLLFACATHQVTETSVQTSGKTTFSTLHVWVNFATPAQSEYLANQLVSHLHHYGVRASLVTDEVTDRASLRDTALLHVTLTASWTDTVITHRHKHRRSLTQMRGRIPRESPRFRSEILLQDLSTGKTVWQSNAVTAGAWYSDFNTMARSLAARLTRQLKQEALIGSKIDPASKPTTS